jgi:hypothetical protein
MGSWGLGGDRSIYKVIIAQIDRKANTVGWIFNPSVHVRKWRQISL